jgi:bifunctional DNase/RNase
MEMARPLTYDIFATTIAELGGAVSHILIRDLRNDVFYANILVDHDGERLEIDARPSDAMALAVRAHVPIYVEEKVMEQAGITPEEDIEDDVDVPESAGVNDKDLSVFSDFVDTLDLEDLDSDEQQE